MSLLGELYQTHKRDDREMQPMPGELSSIEHRKVQVHQHSAFTSIAYARH